MQRSSVASRTFVEVMEYLFNRCSATDVETYAEVARRLWFRCNSIVHGGECTHPYVLVSSAVAFIADYQATLDTQETDEFHALQGRAGQARWTPPPLGFLKINCDAALDSHQGTIGFGFLIRDSSGRVEATVCKSAHFLVEPVVVESLAVLCALELGTNRGMDRTILEGDSLQVINAINKSGLNWSKFGHIMTDTHEALRYLPSWKICDICHTKREANSATHVLAKAGIIYNSDRV